MFSFVVFNSLKKMRMVSDYQVRSFIYIQMSYIPLCFWGNFFKFLAPMKVDYYNIVLFLVVLINGTSSYLSAMTLVSSTNMKFAAIKTISTPFTITL